MENELRPRKRNRSHSGENNSPRRGGGDYELYKNSDRRRHIPGTDYKSAKGFDAVVLGAIGLFFWSLLDIYFREVDHYEKSLNPFTEAAIVILLYVFLYITTQVLDWFGCVILPCNSESEAEQKLSSNSNEQTTPTHYTDSSAQTEVVDYRKRHTVLQKKYRSDLIKFRRRMRKLRREFSIKIDKLRKSKDSQGERLSKLQLRIPHLEKQKSLLLGETEAIDKQLEEERRRNKDLFERFGRLNLQLVKNGANPTGAYPKNNRNDRFLCKNRNFPSGGNQF